MHQPPKGARRIILLVTPFAPAADGRHGSARVVHGLVGALADRHDVVVVHPDIGGAVDPDLARRCLEICAYPTPRAGRWRRKLRGGVALARGRSLWADELGIAQLQRTTRTLVDRYAPSVVQVEHGVLGDALAGSGPGALRVVTLYDPAEFQADATRNATAASTLFRIDTRVALRQQRRIIAAADATVVFSDRDRALIERTASASSEVVTIAVGWDVPPQPLDPIGTGPESLLFVGNFMHEPNVDAALRAAQQVLPRVRVEHPDARLVLVGANAPPEVIALRSDSVEVTGEVDDVIPYLDRAAVVLAPIALGGGTRIKVLEALAAGKAVVGSTSAAQGTNAARADAIVIGDTDEDLAAACVRLLHDPDERRRQGARARDWAVHELAWSKMADRYDEVYERLERRRDRASA